MIRLKELISPSMATSEWDKLIDNDVVLTKDVILFYRDTRLGSFKVKAGNVLHIEAKPSHTLAGSVTVSYKGELYSTDGQNLMTSSKIKQ